MEGKFELQFEDNEYYLVDGNTNDTVATTDKVLLNKHDGYMKKLSLKNCQAIENGYDLDELARTIREEEESYIKINKSLAEGVTACLHFEVGVRRGFQKALEILGDKKFSEEDMLNAYNEGGNDGANLQSMAYNEDDDIPGYVEELENNFIQSLQQTEWDVEIEMQKVKDETKIIGAVKGVKGSGNKITTYKSVPKLDADGCLILKRK